VAIAAAQELSRRWKKLEKHKILRGIKEARWDGRLEIVARNPLVILDGAHNEEGARAVEVYARNFLPRPRTLVFGIMKDKNIVGVAGRLFPLARTIFLTSFPYKRAASPESISSQAAAGRRGIFLEPDPRKAIQAALKLTPAQGSVLITGSLFLVGEAKKHFSWLPSSGNDSR
jgi:dihydrofolate synthase/folylpolyglutamate synthase